MVGVYVVAEPCKWWLTVCVCVLLLAKQGHVVALSACDALRYCAQAQLGKLVQPAELFSACRVGRQRAATSHSADWLAAAAAAAQPSESKPTTLTCRVSAAAGRGQNWLTARRAWRRASVSKPHGARRIH